MSKTLPIPVPPRVKESLPGIEFPPVPKSQAEEGLDFPPVKPPALFLPTGTSSFSGNNNNTYTTEGKV